MRHPPESAITWALAEIEQGAAIKPTAAKYGVARSTLQGRLRGARPRPIADQMDQRLSPEQERFLASWILHEESSGRAPTRRKSTAMAQSILDVGGESPRLGKNWIDRFLGRHPRDSTTLPQIESHHLPIASSLLDQVSSASPLSDLGQMARVQA
jgi:hypothetical protein